MAHPSTLSYRRVVDRSRVVLAEDHPGLSRDEAGEYPRLLPGPPGRSPPGWPGYEPQAERSGDAAAPASERASTMLETRFARTTAAVVVALVISGIALPGVSQSPKNIVDTAIDAGNFKTFTQALTEAGLTE